MKKRRDVHFDKAWVLYVATGRPAELRSALCSYLSRSEQRSDQDHAWRVFIEIPPERRTEQDYINITASQLRSDEPTELKSICAGAASRGFADIPCALSFAYYARRNDWVNALDIWSVVSQSEHMERRRIISRVRKNTLPRVALDLWSFLSNRAQDDSALQLAKVLLDRISNSAEVLSNAPMDVLLRLLENYRKLGVTAETNYFDMINILQSSDTRQIFIRSILFYRHLREHFPDARPPEKLLTSQISALGSFEIGHGVQFFLTELARFWNKPSIEAYKQALIALSHAGDVSQVNSVFEKFLADHGKPRSRRLLSPLLTVHARAGDVQETLTHFHRIAGEFQLEPNTTCWNILLKAYAAAKDPAGAFSTFGQMVDSGIPPDSYTFGTLMGICAGRGDIDSTRWLLKEAQRLRVKITMPMLDPIAQIYCQNRRVDLAEQLAMATKSMQVQGSPTRMWNMILFNHALRVDKAGWVRARRRMKRRGLRPDAMTLAARLVWFALRIEPDLARRELRKFHKRRLVQATELHYSIVLWAYIRARNRQMVRIVLNEALQRFGHNMGMSSFSKFMAYVDHDLEVLEGQNSSAAQDAQLRLEDTEKSLLRSFTSSAGTSSLAKFPLPKGPEVSANDGLSTSHYEYLVSHYGTRGTIEQATEMFNKYLESRKTSASSENESEPVPFRILNVMMRAHLSAEEYDKVEQLWRMALSSAIKVARPFKLDQFLTHKSPSSSASANLDTSHTPQSKLTGDELERLDSFASESSVLQHQPSVLSSQRFILAHLIPTYMRALAYQNKNEKIYDVVAEFEAAGFEMSGANWSTYVQMLAASDRFADMKEAFQVFEYKFMPNFPGWGPLTRGYGLKPRNAPDTMQKLESKRVLWRKIDRQKRAPFLGRQARRDLTRIQPESLFPTYVTTVYLTAALNRVRNTSITEDKSHLQELFSAAPKTIEMLGRMPYKADKIQGALLRGSEARKDQPPLPANYGFAPGGVLGEDTTRSPLPLELASDQLPQAQQPSEDRQPTDARQPVEDQQTRASDKPLTSPLANNETARLLADVFGSEDPSGMRDDILSREDRLDIESDILYLQNLRHLRETERIIQERQKAYQENLASAQRAEDECEEPDEDELDDELDELDTVDSEELDPLSGPDELNSARAELGKPRKLDQPDLDNAQEPGELSEQDHIEGLDEANREEDAEAFATR